MNPFYIGIIATLIILNIFGPDGVILLAFSSPLMLLWGIVCFLTKKICSKCREKL